MPESTSCAKNTRIDSSLAFALSALHCPVGMFFLEAIVCLASIVSCAATTANFEQRLVGRGFYRADVLRDNFAIIANITNN